MKVLGIETSCDESSVALLAIEIDGSGTARAEIVANLIASQIELHQEFGGVVPEIASRGHLEAMPPLLEKLRRETGVAWEELDLIGVTHGPGLAGALLVGVATAKALSYAHRVPCLPVNHVAGHVASCFLSAPESQFPFLALVVSGGHSDLLLMKAPGQYQRLGRTRDDAIGEAFDKVARALQLPLPGGPNLENAARAGDASAFNFTVSDIAPSFDVSYSGLKTAAAQAARCVDRQRKASASTCSTENERTADIAASFQRVAVQQLQNVVARALDKFQPRTLGVCGGVAANHYLRQQLNEVAAQRAIAFVVPPPILCTDNAAMIAMAAFQQWRRLDAEQRVFSVDKLKFGVHSSLPVAELVVA